MAWTYTSKSLVLSIYKGQASDLKDNWSTWVESLIDNFLGHSSSPVAAYDEYYDGDNTDILMLDHYPIVSVTSLDVSDASLTSSDYKVYERYVQLVYDTLTEISRALYTAPIFPEGRQNIHVVYTAGYAKVPPEVELCASQMIALIAMVSSREGVDASLKYSRVTNQMADGGQTTIEQFGLQSGLQGIMKTYLQKGLKIE